MSASSPHDERDKSMDGLCECCLRRVVCLHRVSRLVQDAQRHMFNNFVSVPPTDICHDTDDSAGAPTSLLSPARRSLLLLSSLLQFACRRIRGCFAAAAVAISRWRRSTSSSSSSNGAALVISGPLIAWCVFVYLVARLSAPFRVPPVVEACLAAVLVIDGDPLVGSIYWLEVFVWSSVLKILFSSTALSAIAAAWLGTLWYLFVLCWKAPSESATKKNEDATSSSSSSSSISTSVGCALRRAFLPLLLLLLLRRKVGIFGFLLQPQDASSFSWGSFVWWDTLALEGLLATLCAVFVASSAICLSDACELEEAAKVKNGDLPSLEEEMLSWQSGQKPMTQPLSSQAKAWRADVLSRLLLRCYVQTGLAHAHAAIASSSSEDAAPTANQHKTHRPLEEADIIPLRAACIFLCLAVVIYENILLFPVTLLYVLLSVGYPLADLFFIMPGPMASDGGKAPLDYLTRRVGSVVVDWNIVFATTTTPETKQGSTAVVTGLRGKMRATSRLIHAWSTDMVEKIVDSSSFTLLSRYPAVGGAVLRFFRGLLKLPRGADGYAGDHGITDVQVSSERINHAASLLSLYIVLALSHVVVYLFVPPDLVFFGAKFCIFFLACAFACNRALSMRVAGILAFIFASVHFMASGLARFAYFPSDWVETTTTTTTGTTTNIDVPLSQAVASFLSNAIYVHCFVLLLVDVLSVSCAVVSPFSSSPSAGPLDGGSHQHFAARAASLSMHAQGAASPALPKGGRKRRH